MITAISDINPLYFPTLMGGFESKTDELAAWECPYEYSQCWLESDIITLYVTDNSGAPRVELNGTVYTPQPILSIVPPNYIFLIPLTGLESLAQYRVTLGRELLGSFVGDHVSWPIRVEGSQNCRGSIFNEMQYYGCGVERGVDFGGIPNTPNLIFTYRLCHSIRFDSIGGEYIIQQNPDLSSSVCYSDDIELYRLLFEFMPKWEIRKMSRILKSRYLFINGTRFVMEEGGRLTTGAQRGNEPLFKANVLLRKAEVQTEIPYKTDCCPV